jgi:hypothetical protein
MPTDTGRIRIPIATRMAVAAVTNTDCMLTRTCCFPPVIAAIKAAPAEMTRQFPLQKTK